MQFNVIITGSTGMVGKGVLLECLESPEIGRVLVINRNPLGMQHPKLEEVLLPDFRKIATVKDRLTGYDACFFSMGVSSLGMSEQQYTKLTFDIAKSFADVLYELNPGMVFNYVSGKGTDSTENGRTMRARVKGRTENYILNKGFKDAYAFRPGAIVPEKGTKSKTGWVNGLIVLLSPFFPLLKKSINITTTTKIGRAMINTLFRSQPLKHLENRNINVLAEKNIHEK